MNTVFKIVCGLLLGIILFQFISYSCDRSKWRKSEQFLNSALDSCFNAKQVPDTVWKFKTFRDTIKLKYNYTIIDTVSVMGDTVLEEREYRGTFASDLLALRWRAIVLGELKGMEILPTSSYRFPQITLTRTVPQPERTPITTNYEKSHLYFTASYYHPELFSAGMQYIRKEGWGLSGGLAVSADGFWYGGGLIIRLK
jgi:hypothetical protein